MERSSTPTAGGLPGWLVATGGVLFAVGNLMHPLEHNEAAHAAATWEAAHLVFAAGGLLIAAGLPWLLAVTRAVRPSRLVTTGGVLLAIAFAALGPGAWFEAFVAPLPGGVADRLESGAGGTVNAIAGTLWILAMLIFGLGLVLRGGARPVRVVGGCLLAAVAVLLAGPALPVAEGLWIIPASVVAGLSFTTLAAVAHRRTPAPGPAAPVGSPA